MRFINWHRTMILVKFLTILGIPFSNSIFSLFKRLYKNKTLQFTSFLPVSQFMRSFMSFSLNIMSNICFLYWTKLTLAASFVLKFFLWFLISTQWFTSSIFLSTWFTLWAGVKFSTIRLQYSSCSKFLTFGDATATFISFGFSSNMLFTRIDK